MIKQFEEKTGIKFADYYVNFKEKLKYHLNKKFYVLPDLDDKIQDCFLHLLKQIKYYTPERSLDTFFITISINYIIQQNNKAQSKNFQRLNTDFFTPRDWDELAVLSTQKEEDDTMYQNRLKHLEKYLKINPELYNKFYISRLQGNTIEETAKELNVNINKIIYFWRKITSEVPSHLKSSNCLTRKRLTNRDEIIDEIVKMKNEGLSYRQISLKLDITISRSIRLYKYATGYSPSGEESKYNIYKYEKNFEGKYVCVSVIHNPHFKYHHMTNHSV